MYYVGEFIGLKPRSVGGSNLRQNQLQSSPLKGVPSDGRMNGASIDGLGRTVNRLVDMGSDDLSPTGESYILAAYSACVSPAGWKGKLAHPNVATILPFSASFFISVEDRPPFTIIYLREQAGNGRYLSKTIMRPLGRLCSGIEVRVDIS
ncbi:hypothetical protein ON010_g1271 [Phytophthora cinnamomi]|nr:hypothetical protein ON010_g1271 [Phytophthora cinnamomi]